MLVDPFRYACDPEAVTRPMESAKDVPAPTIVQLFNYEESMPAWAFPAGWPQFHCNDCCYYNSVLINPQAAGILDLKTVENIVRAAKA